ncbi:hypothetical protein [Streptomyces cinereoruber]|uniref:hypothetical protein n=1 Tax=Streptomyces cinereoruber TaxID=67260 RepID=UPI0036436600
MDKDANELAVMTEAEAKCRGQLPAAAPEPTVTVLALFLTEAKALSEPFPTWFWSRTVGLTTW